MSAFWWEDAEARWAKHTAPPDNRTPTPQELAADDDGEDEGEREAYWRSILNNPPPDNY